MDKKNGFTLSELLVVIAIIALISVIAIPSVLVVNKNIKKRLLKEKEQQIIISAELYASDNPDIFNGKTEAEVSVSHLIETAYLNAEVKKGSKYCDADSGCILDPTNNESMNDRTIILTKIAGGVVGKFSEDSDDTVSDSTGGTDDDIVSDSAGETLVGLVCERLNNGKTNKSGIKFIGKDEENQPCDCNDFEDKNIEVCLITGNGVNNYLKYNSDMWRVMGIYNINYNNEQKLTAKIISDDNVEMLLY